MLNRTFEFTSLKSNCYPMSRVVSIPVKNMEINWRMMAFLKIMHYCGYLPINWKAEDDPSFDEIKFEISKLKTVVMFVADFALALWIPLYFYIWHRINLGEDFDMSLLLKPSYYVGLNDGVVTTAISQMIYMTFAVWIFWLYSFIGQ